MAGGLNNLAQTLGKTDANGALIVTLAAGSAVVTSVQGTSNQILANAATTAQTGAVVLTIPSTFIAPGSIAATTTVDGTTITGSVGLVGPFVRGAAASILTLSTNGKVLATNSAANAGVMFDFATDATLKLFARDGTSAATLNMGGGVINGTEDTWTIGGAGGNRPAFLSFSTGGKVLWNADTSISWGATSKLILGSNTAANGVRLDFSTAGTLAVQANAGGDTATVKANVVNATGKFQINGVDGVTASGITTGKSLTIVNGLVTAYA